MKINKKYLLLRIIAFPLKLLFTIIWFLLFAIFKSIQWVAYGSDEIVFRKDFNRNSITELIETIEKLQDK